MKKGKVFGKRQLVVATLVVCLAAAVWLNMKYSSFSPTADNYDSSKNLEDVDFIDTNSNLGEAINTSTGVNYIATVKTERNKNRTETVKGLTETVNNSSTEESTKKEALLKLTSIAEAIDKESAVETIIKSKGISEALCIISDESVTVIVAKESLLSSETLQIQDAVTSQIEIDLEKIKIITVK